MSLNRVLHIHAQAQGHRDVEIVGDREALLLLFSLENDLYWEEESHAR